MSYRLLGTADNRYEGFAALQLQAQAQQVCSALSPAAFAIENVPRDDGFLLGDWRPAWRELLMQATPASAALHALAFHHGLARWACALAQQFGVRHLSLSGGCFQNRLLQSLLRDEGRKHAVETVWSATIPLNDGGLALGQVLAPSILPFTADTEFRHE